MRSEESLQSGSDAGKRASESRRKSVSVTSVGSWQGQRQGHRLMSAVPRVPNDLRPSLARSASKACRPELKVPEASSVSQSVSQAHVCRLFCLETDQLQAGGCPGPTQPITALFLLS